MSDDIIRYDLIVQEALLGAVRKILITAAQEGLPGEHHFFVTFRTTAPGVQLSKRMRAQYPEEMTIVLQHQFWDLIISEDHFEVGLSFKNVPEKLYVPFDALSGFADPSVQFALRFDVDALETSGEASQRQDNIEGSKPPSLVPANPLHKTSGKDEGKPAAKNASDGNASDGTDAVKKDDESDKDADAPKTGGDDDSGKVVSIDAFRKKT